MRADPRLPLPWEDGFLATVWRTKPVVYRRLVPPVLLKALSFRAYGTWLKAPTSSIRLFQTTDERRQGTARATAIQDGRDAARIIALLRRRGESATLLLNGADRCEPNIRVFQAALRLPFSWRQDDVVATYSLTRSGIGYHAGHEDGFLIQLRGTRRWRIWAPSHTPIRYRRSLLDPSSQEAVSIFRPQSTQPLVDTVITAGDAIYLPPFFPHEGTTGERSLALSVAWKGYAPISFLGMAAPHTLTGVLHREPRRLGPLCTLLPDVVPLAAARQLYLDMTWDALPPSVATTRLRRALATTVGRALGWPGSLSYT
jgi:50S ribosomal protein L16 3-hydroxylase